MDINKLYRLAVDGEKRDEDSLFSSLSEIFLLFVRQRVWNIQDCREIVQDTLTAIAEKYRSVEFDISFSSWAYKILLHKVMNYYRTKRMRESKFSQISESIASESVSPINPILVRNLTDCLKEIHNFNQKHARILNLRYQGFEIDEICRKLQTTRENAYVSLFRARAMLKECLKKREGE